MGCVHELHLARVLLEEMEQALDFTRDGLGDQACDAAADAIQSRFQAETGADDPFADNRGKYGERKRERGIPIGIGLHGARVGGEMSRRIHFAGMREIEPDEVIIGFGADDKNRRKGMWFEAGSSPSGDIEPSGAKGQPPRPFFHLADKDEDAIVDLVSESIDRFLSTL